MHFIEMQATARAVRAKYVQVESERYGRSWTAEEIMLGFLGDVGDLAKLVQGKAGVRPRDDLDDALAHELADCLWAVLTLADTYGVDLETAFADTMHALTRHLDDVRDTPWARTRPSTPRVPAGPTGVGQAPDRPTRAAPGTGRSGMAEKSGKGSDTAKKANAKAKKDGKKNPRTSSAAQSELGKKGGKKKSKKS